MSKRVRRAAEATALLAFVVALTGTAASGSSGPLASSQEHCTRQAAVAAVRQHHLESDPGVRNPVAQVLCRAVLGPGREAMVASITIPSCGHTGNWAVFGYEGGRWQLVFQSRNGAELAVVVNDINETQQVLRPSDSHCFPTGGTRSRIWHWIGGRFIGTPWAYMRRTKQDARTTHYGEFESPSGNIWCRTGHSNSAVCATKAPARSVRLRRDGTVTVCAQRRCGGPARWIRGGAPVLRYGRSNEHEGFGCVSRKSGITCTITTRGRGYGAGFQISRSGVRRIAVKPPPPPPAVQRNAAFWVPLPGAIACGVSVGQPVICESLNPKSRPNDAHMATLKPDGSFTTCRGLSASCPIGNPGEDTPGLAVGQSVTVGPFRCQVSDAGVRCIVTATGKGFLFSENGTTPVG